MPSWKRTGWVTEKSDEYELVDFWCAACGHRIGIPQHQVEDSDLLKRILKSATCKCRKR